MKFFTFKPSLYLFLLWTCLNLSYGQITEKEKQEIKLQITATGSMPRAAWNVIKGAASAPKIAEFTFGQSITALVLTGHDIGLNFHEETANTPSQIAKAIKPNFLSPVSLIQTNYIKEITFEGKGEGVIQGEFSFECPKTYKGKLGYKAEKRNKNWFIVEYTIPNRGSKLRLEKITNNKDEEGYDIWMLNFKGEVWILREIHIVFRSSENIVVYPLKIAPSNPGIEGKVSDLKRIFQENPEDKIFFSFRPNLRVSDLFPLFKECQKLKIDLSNHISFDGYFGRKFSSLIQALNQQFSKPKAIDLGMMVLSVKGKKDYEIRFQQKSFQLTTQDVNNEYKEPESSKMGAILELLKGTKKIMLQVDKKMELEHLNFIYQRFQQAGIAMELTTF